MSEYSKEVLLAIRANLLRGLDVAAAHLDAGTLDTPPGPKAAPPREAAHMTVALLEWVDAELEDYGVHTSRRMV